MEFTKQRKQCFYDSQKRYSFQGILWWMREFEQCLFQYREYYESEEVLNHIILATGKTDFIEQMMNFM